MVDHNKVMFMSLSIRCLLFEQASLVQSAVASAYMYMYIALHHVRVLVYVELCTFDVVAAKSSDLSIILLLFLTPVYQDGKWYNISVTH